MFFLTLGVTVYTYVKDRLERDHQPEVEVVVRKDKVKDAVEQTLGVEDVVKSQVLSGRFLDDISRDVFAVKLADAQVIEKPIADVVAKPEVQVEVKPLLPPEPTAPPLPFIYIGKYIEDNQLVVFLGYRGNNLLVKAGDIIQQTYKIETINPPVLTLTYLPMNIRQTIQIGELQ